MIFKLASTLILSKPGFNDDCKCEIYQQSANDGLKFYAHIYVLREVNMHLPQRPYNTSRYEQPTSKPVNAWVHVRMLRDLTDTSLESVEVTINDRYLNEPFFIPHSLDTRFSSL